MSEEKISQKAGVFPAQRTMEDLLSVGLLHYPSSDTELTARICDLEKKIGQQILLELTIPGKQAKYGSLAKPHSSVKLVDGANIHFESDPALLSQSAKAYFRDIAPYLALAVRSVMEAESQRTLAGLALTDGLTGLRNRRALDRLLGDELAELKEQERSERKRNSDSAHGLSVVMLDVDNFKAYNDRHGHAGGDETLRILANYLKHGRRKHDGVFRYGGEEFTIVLPDCPLEAAIKRANEVRSYVEAHSADDARNGCLPERFTISLGVANTFELPQDLRYGGQKNAVAGMDYHVVMCADKRLYAAKKEGRNRVNPIAPAQ